MKKFWVILTLVFSGFSLDSWGSTSIEFDKADLRLLDAVIENIQKYYYQDVSKETLFRSALQGMVSKLDPHSDFLNPEEMKELEDETAGKFSGIGIEIIPDRGAILVVAPIEGAAAHKAGLKAGDYIIQVNDVLVKDMTLKNAVSMIRGEPGSLVKLTVIRQNITKPLIFNVKREIIKVKSVRAESLLPGYGYIRLSLFQERSSQEVKEAISKFKADHQSLKGLILDLRNNPGGLLDAAVEVADLFLDSTHLKHDGLVVYTESKVSGFKMAAKAQTGELLAGVPIVVLINGGSASASEIVAGALQDHQRALIVGQKSFGKGSVQMVIPLEGQNALKLTTAIYYTPKGRSIQAEGVIPDVEIEDIPIDRETLNAKEPKLNIEEASFAGYIKVEKTGKKNKAPAKVPQVLYRNATELVREDYQLYEALQLIQGLASMQRVKETPASEIAS